MKILITTDLYQPSVNGVVTSIVNLKKELEEQGHEVRILTMSSNGISHQNDQVYYIKSMPSHIYPEVRVPVSRASDIVKELVEWEPDIVHSQCEFFSFGYAKRIAEESGAGFVHTYHTLYEQYTEYLPLGKKIGKAALSKWMRIRLKNVDTIIAPTKKVENTLLEYGLVPEIEIVPTGIDLKNYNDTVSEESLEQLRIQLGYSKEHKILLSLGRLGFEKRIDEILYGMKELVKTENQIRLLVVGGGPARESLEALTEQLELQGYVKFVGMVEPSKVRQYYHLADAFVCASTSETQGLTYIEAAASGLPLICHRDPCLFGVLEEGGNGYSYEEVSQFAEQVKKLFSDEKLCKEAGEYSRKLAGKFGTKKFGQNVMAIYRASILKGALKYEGIAICKKSANRV